MSHQSTRHARKAMKYRKFDLAIELFQQALQDRPDPKDVAHSTGHMGMAYYYKGDYEQARDYLGSSPIDYGFQT